MIYHHLCDASVQYSINDAAEPNSTTTPVPDINNNEDNLERGKLERGQRMESSDSRTVLVVKDSLDVGSTRLTSTDSRCHWKSGNENEAGIEPSSSFDDQDMSMPVSKNAVQMIPPSKELFTLSTLDHNNNNNHGNDQKVCSSSGGLNLHSNETIVRSDSNHSANSQNNNLSVGGTETDPEPNIVIGFDEIRDDIELIVDIYLFIEKSSWALKGVLW